MAAVLSGGILYEDIIKQNEEVFSSIKASEQEKREVRVSLKQHRNSTSLRHQNKR